MQLPLGGCLAGNDIGDEGAKAIAEGLKTNGALQTLKLDSMLRSECCALAEWAAPPSAAPSCRSGRRMAMAAVGRTACPPAASGPR